VMVGTLGGTIGHVASAVALQNNPPQHTISIQGSGSHDAGVVFTIRTQTAMDI
jgi:hypothetical protein